MNPHRRNALFDQGEGAFGVDHHRVGFGPRRGRKDDVGVAIGGRVAVRILGDNQLRSLQARDDDVTMERSQPDSCR